MKIALAQTRAVKGDIQKNIIHHIKLTDRALSSGADMIIFPELSLTGYEPGLAKDLATDQDDTRLDALQQISDAKQITIGAGIPTKDKTGVHISMILFQPGKARLTYSKKYLHSDEEPYFESGENITGLIINNTRIALAICYELSIPAHSEEAYKNGSAIYIASVAKTADGVAKAFKSLGEIAVNYSMQVMLCNCVGPSDNFESAGQSAVWNNKGKLLAQLNDKNEGILMLDTATEEVILNAEII